MNNQNLGMGIAAENPGIFAQEMPNRVVSRGEMQGMPGERQGMSGERQEAFLPGNERQVNAGLENAVGVVAVGASGTPGNMPQVQPNAPVSVQEAKTDENKLERVPEEAKDGEKMEKTWMKRAQELVAETRKDPNKRLVQAALLREEYMRLRFNRILGEHN